MAMYVAVGCFSKKTYLPQISPDTAGWGMSIRRTDAIFKARSVAVTHPSALIVGSDQVADVAGRAVGKPADRRDAREMLTGLAGKTVVFHTGIALLDAASGRCMTAMVDVRSIFRRLSDADINAYLDREQPYDCAGAVKSEGLGIALFEAIESDDPTALIGLPLITLTSMLRDAGVPVLSPRN